MSAPLAIATRDLAPRAVPIALREAFARVAGIDGAEAPGADAFLPARPRVFSSRTIERVARTAEHLWAAFDAEVRRGLKSKGAAQLARSLGFEPYEVELIAATPSILAPPVRADFVPTRQGYRLVEWNVDPCLGGLAGRMIFDCFEQAGATRGLSFRDPAVALVPTFARLAGQVRGILVTIREADLPRWRLNAQSFADVARAAGLDSRVVPLERLSYELSEAGALPWGVVRFFHFWSCWRSFEHSFLAQSLRSLHATICSFLIQVGARAPAEQAFVWCLNRIASCYPDAEEERMRSDVAAVFRHVAGNPFRRPWVSEACPSDVVHLAEAMYAGQDCHHYALHDALLEAGHEELAEHFREPGHPKGCWALDLILGKS